MMLKFQTIFSMTETIFGIAITLITIAIPYLWPQLSNTALVLLVSFGTLLIGLITGSAIQKRFGSDKPKKLKTCLRLQFFGDNKTPIKSHSENIHYWYSMWSESKNILMQKSDGQVVHQSLIPKTWTIFVTFEKPISFTQMEVSFSAPGFPGHEVKHTNSRFAIIHIQGDVPAGSLEISALLT